METLKGWERKEKIIKLGYFIPLKSQPKMNGFTITHFTKALTPLCAIPGNSQVTILKQKS